MSGVFYSSKYLYAHLLKYTENIIKTAKYLKIFKTVNKHTVFYVVIVLLIDLRVTSVEQIQLTHNFFNSFFKYIKFFLF